MKTILLSSTLLLSVVAFSQNDTKNGDWKKRNVSLNNTPECDLMIRQGDIDNLGFGWEENFNPFSGKSTPAHSYPWESDSTEILGYDMILLSSSSGVVNEPCGGDGYSGQKSALMEKYSRSVFDYEIPLAGIDTSKIKSVSLQLFVDDFQAPVLCSKFTATINGVAFPELSKTLNSINQTGPIGKLITVKAGPEIIKEFKKNSVKIIIDDSKTGANDGFAIDFIKVMVNPKVMLTGNFSGKIMDTDGKAVKGAIVECGGLKATTDATGAFKFTGLVAGLNILTVTAKDFPEKTFSVDIEEKQNTSQDLILEK